MLPAKWDMQQDCVNPSTLAIAKRHALTGTEYLIESDTFTFNCESLLGAVDAQ